jgi:hypothetical protein
MKQNTQLSFLVWVILILFVDGASADAEETPQATYGRCPLWSEIDQSVAGALFDPKISLQTLVAKVGKRRSMSCRESLFKLNILMRAGKGSEAIDELQRLRILAPVIGELLEEICDAACDTRSTWKVASTALELFATARNYPDVHSRRCVIEQAVEEDWEMDQWLASRSSESSDFQVTSRREFNSELRRGEFFLRKLSEQVRQYPEDIDGAIKLLNILYEEGGELTGDQSLSWLTDSLKPQKATQAKEIAVLLERLKAYTTAIAFYKLALAIPFPEEKLQLPAIVYELPAAKRARFEATVHEGLARCLVHVDQREEARRRVWKAVRIRDEFGLAQDAYSLGVLDAATGFRIGEKLFLAEDGDSRDDSEYWVKLTGYYRGLNDPVREERAHEQQLLQTRLLGDQEAYREGERAERRLRAVTMYSFFLKRRNRRQEAVELLRTELSQLPADSKSAEAVAKELSRYFGEELSGDSQILWDRLEKQAKWEHTEERLLFGMLEKAKPEELQRVLVRAETLTKNGDPSRAFILGRVMNRIEQPERSITLLKYAHRKIDDKKKKSRVALELFKVYLDVGDWRNAKKLFPQAKKRLTRQEQMKYYFRIANAAYKAGDKKAAASLWKSAAQMPISPF